MNSKKVIIFFVLGMMLIPTLIWAQTEPDQVTLDTSQFEENFYESLKHKSMENYDRAIEALEKCDNLEPNNEAVTFELAKNYFFQKKYKQAYDYFQKVTQINPKNRWAWHGMYDVCYETRDYNQAIPIVEKLIEFKDEYKDDLLSLYMNTQQYDKALTLINELNDLYGTTDRRDMFKKQILQDARYQGSEKENLISQIKKNPKEEKNYLQLIYLYSQSNQEEKALEVAKQLEKEIPTSDWAQVSLFKFHLSNNDGEKAVKAMNIALASDKIDNKIKHRILNEFIVFSKNNPVYEKDLDKAISYFDNDKEVKVAKEIGKFYQNKKVFDKAIKYYQMHLKSANEDMEAILLLSECYKDSNDFQKLAQFSEQQMQLFPTQPDLYYYNGLANNQLKQFKKAKDALESGIDFVVDNTALEINFNIQLGESYAALGDNKKKETYFKKAEDLLKKAKKQ